MTIAARDQLVTILQRDLIGPRDGPDEILRGRDRPGDRYLTGALYPAPVTGAEQLSDEADADPEDGESAGPGEAVDLGSTHRPISMGLSFLVSGAKPVLELTGSAGRYSKNAENGAWHRKPIAFRIELSLPGTILHLPAATDLQWTIRPVATKEGWLVSVVLTNVFLAAPGRDATDEGTFFQAEFAVRVKDGSVLPRRQRTFVTDADAASDKLIYRNAAEYASGHACSATWVERDGTIIASTTWMPLEHVPGISADGHAIFSEYSARLTGSSDGAFEAERLASASRDELRKLLSVVPNAYLDWLTREEERARNFTGSMQLAAEDLSQLEVHLAAARALAGRMIRGIDAIADDPVALEAFRLAQQAMIRQARWRRSDSGFSFRWRPFQLGFQLLAMPGLSLPTDSTGASSFDRQMVELLWFPTGGGKTEAYLGLVAFGLFLRRLRRPENPDDGAGVGAFMRYTLRLLSSQQFERAARLIVACESMRRTEAAGGIARLGTVQFSVGLWVGADATPNFRKDCADPEEKRKARQLAACPACNDRKSLSVELLPDPARVAVWCTNAGCPTAGWELPVWTVDEDVYERRPSLVIATVDKFAQVVRAPAIRQFLRVDDNPPDLIIQDELHLISGPLGSMVGLYEVAIERLCARDGVPPKIVGSTATIRHAERQVRDLYARPVQQFPPPVLDAGDSCFAVTDLERPGRLYLGLTSSGRSPKFLLQAVSAILLQGAEELPAEVSARDPFWTLLLYFNSLRELGGALVMLLDDVSDTMKLLSSLSGAPTRQFESEPMEMTSRTGSSDLPEQLKRLEEPWPQQHFGPVLATNMISVGVDVERLGLMVVNGQPKSMAEYIQATSRVGRERTPGLIITCYNAGRARDRSHYESFRTWHQALYRSVEASTVTPFAPRARDRALHAPLVALVRHGIEGMSDNVALGDLHAEVVEAIIDLIGNRAGAIDPEERAEVLAELRDFVTLWREWGTLEWYWNDRSTKKSLLISAERAADLAARSGKYSGAAMPTPNSMRNVEPSSVLVMREHLAQPAQRGT